MIPATPYEYSVGSSAPHSNCWPTRVPSRSGWRHDVYKPDPHNNHSQWNSVQRILELSEQTIPSQWMDGYNKEEGVHQNSVSDFPFFTSDGSAAKDLIRRMRSERQAFIKVAQKNRSNGVMGDQRAKAVNRFRKEYSQVLPHSPACDQLRLIAEYIRTASALFPLEKNETEIGELFNQCELAVKISNENKLPVPSGVFISMINTLTPLADLEISQERVAWIAARDMIESCG